MGGAQDQLTIESPPIDGVSAVHFSPVSSNHLLVSSWDSQVRLYNLADNSLKSVFQHRAAVLGCTFEPGGQYAYSGGLDTWVRRLDLNTEKIRVLGTHTAAVSSVVHSQESNALITGSWDRTVKLWDPRQGNPKSLISSHEQPERVYCMDIVKNTLVVATAGRRVQIYDTRNMAAPSQERVSSLKFGTSSLACMPDGSGFAMGSVEGRVSVELFEETPEVQARKYAFKCHRQVTPEGDVVYPVNALAFHPIYGTFASGGSDGRVAVWDHFSKKRLRQYPAFPAGVSALAFSAEGTKMAIGASYSWDVPDQRRREELKERGDEMETISIVVRDVGEETKPKTGNA